MKEIAFKDLATGSIIYGFKKLGTKPVKAKVLDISASEKGAKIAIDYNQDQKKDYVLTVPAKFVNESEYKDTKGLFWTTFYEK